MPQLLRAALVALCATSCALAFVADARAGGVLAKTRVVFPGDAPEVTVRLTNKRTAPVLVEAWIERGDVALGQAPAADAMTIPFEIVPPVFRLDAGRGQALRVHRVPGTAPEDRESLYWLNVFESPSVPAAQSGNAMHIAVRTRVKVFLRPPGLPGSAITAPDQLVWRLADNDAQAAFLHVDNPTPYHVTISRVALGSDALDLRGEMVAPFGHVTLRLDAPTFDGTTPHADRRLQALRSRKTIEFHFVNDSGGAERRSGRLVAETP